MRCVDLSEILQSPGLCDELVFNIQHRGSRHSMLCRSVEIVCKAMSCPPVVNTFKAMT